MPASHESTVLLIDDEPDILAGLAAYLQATFPGLRVLQARDADTAIQRLATQRVDLVLADYRMPGRNGLEILMEAARRLPAVPRVMFTAFPDLGLAVDAINEARVRRFLVKPLEPETLRTVVSDLLNDPTDTKPPQSGNADSKPPQRTARVGRR